MGGWDGGMVGEGWDGGGGMVVGGWDGGMVGVGWWGRDGMVLGGAKDDEIIQVVEHVPYACPAEDPVKGIRHRVEYLRH